MLWDGRRENSLLRAIHFFVFSAFWIFTTNLGNGRKRFD